MILQLNILLFVVINIVFGQITIRDEFHTIVASIDIFQDLTIKQFFKLMSNKIIEVRNYHNSTKFDFFYHGVLIKKLDKFEHEETTKLSHLSISPQNEDNDTKIIFKIIKQQFPLSLVIIIYY